MRLGIRSRCVGNGNTRLWSKNHGTDLRWAIARVETGLETNSIKVIPVKAPFPIRLRTSSRRKVRTQAINTALRWRKDCGLRNRGSLSSQDNMLNYPPLWLTLPGGCSPQAQ